MQAEFDDSSRQRNASEQRPAAPVGDEQAASRRAAYPSAPAPPEPPAVVHIAASETSDITAPPTRLRLTIIPILLTNGVLLPLLGGAWFLTDDESPWRASGHWLPVVCIASGAVMFATGIVNMLALKPRAHRRLPNVR